jgi:hypothetical protein
MFDAFSDVPSCESIVEGVEISEDFNGCIVGQTLYVLLGYGCDDGRELIKLGDEGDPWRGSAFLPGPFLSWEVHGDQPWDECYGYD